jgi:hypothetical protein
MAEKKFADGLIFKRPRQGAPEFVKGSLSIKVDEFVKFLLENESNGWVNLDMLKSKEKGNIYFTLNDWKPTSEVK